MKAVPFSTPNDLTKYVADNAIVQSKVSAIWFVQGQWWLFYYT